jgi:hypothetical protein
LELPTDVLCFVNIHELYTFRRVICVINCRKAGVNFNKLVLSSNILVSFLLEKERQRHKRIGLHEAMAEIMVLKSNSSVSKQEKGKENNTTRKAEGIP